MKKSCLNSPIILSLLTYHLFIPVLYYFLSVEHKIRTIEECSHLFFHTIKINGDPEKQDF